MKQKLLLLVTMLTMAWAGMSTVEAATVTFKIKGVDVDVDALGKSKGTKVGNILVEKDMTGKQILIELAADVNDGSQVINVPDGQTLISYSGDQYDGILVFIPYDLTVNCKNSKMFSFQGSSTKYAQVEFTALNSPGKAYTLTCNLTVTEAGYTRPLFDLSYTRLTLNTYTKRKLNLELTNTADKALIFNAFHSSYLQFGYGDVHMVANDGATKYRFFGETNTGDMHIIGLGRFDSYDENNYLSTPLGAQVYDNIELKDCKGDEIRGEVTLKYFPTNYAYFDAENYSDWRLQQDCSGDVTLQIKGAGDLSELDPATLPWKPYADMITKVEVSSDMMLPLTKLPKGAFAGLTALKSASLYGADALEELPENCFLNCSKLEGVTFHDFSDALKSVGRKAFCDCSAMTVLELPESIEEIGDSAFFHCAKSEVTLPKSLKKVGFRAFSNCHIVKLPKDIGEGDAVEWVERDENVKASYYAFTITRLVFEGTLEEWLARDNSWIMSSWSYNNYSTGGHLNIDGKDIEDLVIPEGITEIKPYAFSKAVHLKSVKFPSTLTKIGESAFHSCFHLEAIDLPDDVTELGEFCFESCEHAVTLKLPKNLTVIPEGAFASGESLTEITWPEKLTTVGEGAFEECVMLKSLKLPETVTTLSHSAFYGLVSLEEVTLPKNLKSLSPGAFFQCVSLKKVIVPAGMGDVEEINLDDILKDLTEEEIAMYQSFFYFPYVTEIRFGGDLDEWLGKSRPWLMKNVALDYEDEFGNQVKQSAELYMAGNDEPLKDIVVPESVTEIPAYAFRKTTLRDIILHEQVTSIGEEAFARCADLSSVETKAIVPPTLGENAFADHAENAELSVPSASVKEYMASDWAKYFDIAPMNFIVTLVAENGKINVMEDVDLKEVLTNTVLHLTAEADYGYEFSSWENYNPETGLVVTSDTTVTAIFVPKTFTLSVTADPAEGGTFNVTGLDEKNQGKYMTEFTIVASPAEGYEFVGWKDGDMILDNKTTTMSGALYGDVQITGLFQKKTADTFTVSVYVAPAGSGTVIGAGEYKKGETATLVAIENEGYKFDHWSDNDTSNPRDIIVDKNYVLIAHFIKNDEQGIDEIGGQEGNNHKVLQNGMLLIERDGATYTLTGQKVK